MYNITVETSRRVEAVDITDQVERLVRGLEGKLLHVYTPHTTCGITINEDADPDVMRDVLDAFDRLVPRDYGYRHREGNSDAHVKSSMVGSSVTIPLHKGGPGLGTWQGIFLMEFDGPRKRKVLVTLI